MELSSKSSVLTGGPNVLSDFFFDSIQLLRREIVISAKLQSSQWQRFKPNRPFESNPLDRGTLSTIQKLFAHPDYPVCSTLHFPWDSV
jgi:hypothetical protein